MAYRISFLTPWLLLLPGCFNPPSSPLDDASTGTVPGSTSDTTAAPLTGDGDSTTDEPGSSGVTPDCLEDTDCSGLDGPCTTGVCDSDNTCVTTDIANGTACDDEQYCTQNDVCMAGECTGDPRPCESTGFCNVGACNEETDSCEPVQDPKLLDMPCDDEDPCTGEGMCSDGECQAGPDACVALDNDCQVGFCGAKGCEVAVMNEGMACNVSICGSSTCQAGTCTVIDILNEGAACDDGLWCTAYELCVAGVCTPGVVNPCLGDQGCGAWTCDDDLDACVVAPQNEGAMCDDGISCTAGTLCQAGECTGMIPMEVFSETFADNVAGWTLGAEWEIGPTQSTPCDSDRGCFSIAPTAFPGGDPDLDHTPTDDNGVAGVVIGGIIDQNVHPFSYLESPPFDGDVAGPLTLSYYRWLNSDYTPFIENRIEVYDGATWVVVWVTGDFPPVADAPWTTASGVPGEGWTYQEFDVTSYKNPQMRVRFGFNVDSDGVYAAPGWNVDDVRVAATGCADMP